MANTIEAASSSASGKTNWFKRLTSSTAQGWKTVAKGPSVSHSIAFGVAAGLASYAAYYTYRGVKLTFFDTETIALQSRKRYFEKQQLYQEELGKELAAGYIGHFVPQYDPIATRLPFQPLDPKYRF